MDIKDLKIVPPEGMEYYIEENEIKFRPKKKKLTYDDIARELFYNKLSYYIGDGNDDNIFSSKIRNIDYIFKFNNCTSKKQAKKLLAINRLMNVAKYLNGDWQPNWNNEDESKYYLYVGINKINIDRNWSCCHNSIYFKTRALAQQAIEILGEETIKLALSTDW